MSHAPAIRQDARGRIAPAAQLVTPVRLLGAAVSGLLLYAGFAPSTAWWAPILGFAVLAVSIRGCGWRLSALLGLVAGATLFFPLLSWTNIYVGNVPWIALASAESLLVMPAVALIGPASRRLPAWPVWAACAWVAGETLRAEFPFGGFPWGGVAFTQPDGPLLPIAAVLGEAGLAFATALSGFALGALALRCWRWWRHDGRPQVTPSHDDAPEPGPHRPTGARRGAGLAAAVGLVAVPFLGGLASIPAVVTGEGAPSEPIAIVQGNVPQPGLEFNARRRAVLDMHAAETARLAEAVAAGTVPQPVAVIWPENSSDIDPYRNADAAAVITRAARQVGVPILVGAVVRAGQLGQHDGSKDQIGHVYNMGIVWDPVTGPGQTYTKRHPVPFAEYVPYRDFFRFFSDKVDLVTADFLPGDRPGNLMVGGVPIGDVICFEIVENELVRDVVTGGAKVIVVQTNNATFGYTNETYQQQAMSRVRAVEYGREVLISATSGVSAVIRPDGTVTDTIPLFTAGFMVPQVPLISATTPATYLGVMVRWIVTALCPIALAGAVAFGWRRRRRAHGGSQRVTDQEEPVA